MVSFKHTNILNTNKAKKYPPNKSLRYFGIERKPTLTKKGLKRSLSFAKNAQQTFLPSQIDTGFFLFQQSVEDLQAEVKAQKASAVVDTL